MMAEYEAKLSRMVDRTHREVTDEDIRQIVDAYYFWWTGKDGYADVPGFCKNASLDEVRKHGHVLTVGATSAWSRGRTMASRSRTR